MTAAPLSLPVTQTRSRGAWAPFASIVIAVTLGQLAPIAQPYQVGALASSGARGASFAGVVISIEMALYALCLILVSRYVARLHLRGMALIGAGLSAVAFFVTWGASHQPVLLTIAAGLGGIGGGLTFAAALGAASQTPEPEKTVGAAAMSALLAYGLFMLVTPILQQRFGASAVFGEIALTMLVLAPGLLALPARGSADAAASRFSLRSTPIICFLAMLCLYGVATGGIYAFMERIGNAIGVPPVINGVILMSGILAGAFGAAIAAKLGISLGRALPLVVSLIATGIACLVMAGTSWMWVFAAATIMFQIFYSMSFPYFIGTGAFLESSGGLAAMAGGVVFLASSAGAAMAGTIVRIAGYPALGAGAMIACLLSAVFVPRMLKGPSPPAAAESRLS